MSTWASNSTNYWEPSPDAERERASTTREMGSGIWVLLVDTKLRVHLLTAQSPIYSLMLGTQCMIVLSSDQAVKDLLDKRSNIYSSRPDMYLANIVSNSQRMLLL